ncbi:MAG: hypothetical protein OM95_12990 [Bdellovibrio sp. ArHS]|uniref:endonuclease/exonuclease/phosphatase family protein n=1 Tax=Bdellovibrio sp. ArHS TaxID=1569284 RepID=UPI000582FFE8|nr:endonuclease/exonuclease/phosphatase family protein [Bdellovibrio sp. ArHS]KHD87661.1 MAG: hypothetical protein OM95_12990 [Bdellovibrio sp. ArHS]
MTLSRMLAVGLLLLGAQSAQAEMYFSADPSPPKFCLQNFNAYGPIYASKVAERTERMTGFLQGMPKCEVVHLQEVWNEGHIEQIERNLKHQYAISAPNKKARIGLMSLFMTDIKGSHTEDFQVNNEGGVLDSVRVAFNVKKAYHVVRAGFFGIDEDFLFLNTHLHPTSSAVRLTQILDILRWRLAHQDEKLILSGDFNADLDSVERKLLMLTLGAHDAMEDSFGGAYPESFCTYCTGNPLGWMLSDHTFDYIFFSNVGSSGTTLKALEGEVNMRGTPRKPWSDHFGVRVKFSVEPTTSVVEVGAIEARRTETLETLAVAAYILQQEDAKEFEGYARFINELSGQLKNRQGAFNTYFEKYR